MGGARRARNPDARKRLKRLLPIFAVAVLVNYPWELAQAPLYIGTGNFRDMLWHCFRAALGDGVLVLAIFATGLAVARRSDWIEQPGVPGYLVMLIAGLIIAVGVEWVAVHVAQRWSYTDRMPLLPGLEVGVVPILQMLLLPPLIFRAVALILRNR